MTNIEKQFFKKLCSYLTTDKKQLSQFVSHATPEVLGMIFFNRMQSIAYMGLKQAELLGKVNREFRVSLRDAYEQNVQKSKSFIEAVCYLADVLKEKEDKYAMLKGAILCGKYPVGCRTSNDIDLLVHSNNVTEIGDVFKLAGFEQGNVRNGAFVPATRREIIESKMMRGETIPYIKEINLPGMRFLEVDINFSLDYKNGSLEALERMLEATVDVDMGKCSVHTLSEDDFFIHLCGHLFKEATTMPWVEMRRDMALYKYCDIYMLLCGMTRERIHMMFCRAMELNMAEICCFAILQTAELFENVNQIAVSMAKGYLAENDGILHEVVSPKEKKIYRYTEKSVFDRFFDWNRKYLLEEECDA